MGITDDPGGGDAGTPPTAPGTSAQEYPQHWEADVVLRDGRPCHLRPIRPDDAEALREFHSHLSARTIYFRYFAPYPHLSDKDVHRFTHVDHVDRVALVATSHEGILGVARYDRTAPVEAEVAFVVRDDQQGRGLGSVLLEHLAAAAHERGVTRFVAEVLPENRRMMATFDHAGYQPARSYDEGVVHMEFRIEPTDRSLAVARAREHRAEARSIQVLLNPRGVVVIGAGRKPGTVGHEVLRHLLDGGYGGPVHVVHPHAEQVLGVPAVRRVTDLTEPVDVAVIAVAAEAVPQMVDECAVAGVHALVVLSGGFAESGPEGRDRQRALVRQARSHGMRVLGPHSFGIINTDPSVRLNASMADAMPDVGRAAVFSQSAALARPILSALAEHALGLSTMVNAGNRADISGNDLLQYWQDDERTRLVLLHLESLGNPRKFARVARALSLVKPVLAVRSGRHSQAYPLGHVIRRTALPPRAVDALFAQAGIIQATTVREMLDVAGVLMTQPLPAGSRVDVVANNDALQVLAVDALLAAGLQASDPAVALDQAVTPEDLAARIRARAASPDVDAVLVVHMPALGIPDRDHVRTLVEIARALGKPLVAVLMDRTSSGVEGDTLCVFPTIEEAARALASATRYSDWLRAAADDRAFLTADVEDLHPDPARTLARSLLAGAGGGPVQCTADEAAALLGWYGLPVLDAGALDAGALDAGGTASDGTAVVRCEVHGIEDELFGPVLSFGLAGPVPELMGDRTYRVPPLSPLDCGAMIRELSAAPLLVGRDGTSDVDVEALEAVLLRIGLLLADLPEVHDLRLDVLASGDGAVVTSPRIVVAEPIAPADIRRLNS